MKKFIYSQLLLIIFIIPSYSQVHDDFTDGDLLVSPEWYGDISNFVHENGSLKSNGPDEKNVIYLSTILPGDSLSEWHLKIDMAFAPSASNQARFYLLSDSSNLQQATLAYYIEIGQTGDDQIYLKKYNNGITTTIFTGNKVFIGEVHATLKVIHSNGEWKLYIEEGGAYNLDAFAKETVVGPQKAYSGILCKYTSTRKDKFYFDDFYAGPLIKDKHPPELNQLQVLNSNSLSLEFNEAIVSSEQSQQLLNDLYPQAQVYVDDNTLILSFDVNFREGENTLYVSGIHDEAGNYVADTLIAFYYYPLSIPGKGNIVINEFMADPIPSFGLPEAEFIELWNVSERHFDLSELTINDKPVVLTPTPFLSGEIIILCPEENVKDFLTYGKAIGMGTWDILKNTEDVVSLKYGNITIDEVSYESSWFQGEQAKGGYSFERIKETFPCLEKDNWKFSLHQDGGSPGTSNSWADKIIDQQPPGIEYAIATDSNWVTIAFSEPLNPNSVQVSDFSSQGMDFLRVSLSEDYSYIYLEADREIPANELYDMEIRRIEDCFENLLEDESINFALPDSLVVGDIIFTEILFDPFPSGVDFVEVLNVSEKILNLERLKISDDTIRQFHLSDRPILFLPGNYLALTTDTNKVASDYPRHGKLFQVIALPSMPNEKGSLFLMDERSRPLDELHYHEDQHLETLNDTEGVSLEKISLDEPSLNTSNWQSASSHVGFASPGLINSQFIYTEDPESYVTLSSPFFTPNQDGDLDNIIINYNFNRSGMTGTFIIYDRQGNKVQVLANNSTLSSSGKFFWDGITTKGHLAHSGHYILIGEVYSVQGDLIKIKEKITLIR